MAIVISYYLPHRSTSAAPVPASRQTLFCSEILPPRSYLRNPTSTSTLLRVASAPEE